MRDRAAASPPLIVLSLVAARPCRSNLNEYFKDSRNVKKLKDPSKPLLCPPPLPT